jgi:hypothetical protein
LASPKGVIDRWQERVVRGRIAERTTMGATEGRRFCILVGIKPLVTTSGGSIGDIGRISVQ